MRCKRTKVFLLLFLQKKKTLPFHTLARPADAPYGGAMWSGPPA